VPKNESNDLFSCMMITTCLIFWMPVSVALAELAELDVRGGAGDGPDEVHAATTSAPATHQAAQTPSRIPRMTAMKALCAGSLTTGDEFYGSAL
jgi:hypothetical protein